jgi:formate--tetrahydrofolate ligase
MTALLRDALQPNLVQTLEHTPALVHGGPFANIAHGCNSVIATRTALKLADYVVTEAGFGSDLGAEKFFNIKCRESGLRPAATVLVATVRALKYNGGVTKADLEREDVAALEAGAAQPPAAYRQPEAPSACRWSELARLAAFCDELGVPARLCTHWAEGGAGAAALAEEVCRLADSGAAELRFSYDSTLPLLEKIRHIARAVYGAADVVAEKKSRAHLHALEDAGYGRLPVCMAKTPYSFTADPSLRGAPEGFELPVIPLCGDLDRVRRRGTSCSARSVRAAFCRRTRCNLPHHDPAWEKASSARSTATCGAKAGSRATWRRRSRGLRRCRGGLPLQRGDRRRGRAPRAVRAWAGRCTAISPCPTS